MKFKVGDKVRLLILNGGHGKVGEVGPIAYVDDHSYRVDFPSQSDYYVIEEHVELASKKVGRPRKERIVEYVVVYDERDRGPAQTFTSRKELEKWLLEAVDNKDIVFDSIRVYTVTNVQKVTIGKKIRLGKV